MKKLISVIVVVVMTLSCCIYASANMTSEQFVDFMSQMNLVDGDEYNGSEKVTRAQFVDFIAKVMGVYSESTEANFANLYSAGVIGRDKTGSFRENDGIICEDAIWAMLVIANYDEAALNSTGYSAFASKYGLSCGKSALSILTWDDVMELLYKTMNLYKMNAAYGTKINYSIDYSTRVMDELFGLEESSGILSVCGETNIYSSKKFEHDRIVIGDIEYIGDSSAYKKYIGYDVSVFYRTDGTQRNIVFIYPKESNSKVILQDEKIIDYKNRVYQYDVNNRTKKYNLSQNVVFLYNGKLPSEASVEFVPDNGWVELIDNTGDKKYDVVLIYSYKNYYVDLTETDEEGVRINSKSQSPVLVVTDSDTWTDTLVMRGDGTIMKPKDIKKGGLVSVFGNVVDGMLIAERLYYTTNSVEGVLDAYNADENKVTIDKKLYQYDVHLKPTIDNVLIGTYRKFMTDFTGKVAYVYEEQPSDYNQGVGYLLGMTDTKGTFEKYIDIKIYDSTGIMCIYSTSPKIYIDGVLISGAEKVIAALKNSPQSGLVAYTLNNDGTLRAIDYPEDKCYGDTSTKPPLNHLVSLGGTSSQVKYRTGINIFGGNLPCNDNTKVLVIPNDPLHADDDEFFVSTPKTYFRDDGSFQNIYGYAYNNSSICADFIVYLAPDSSAKKLTSNDYELMYVIQSIKKVINDDGDEATVIQAIGPEGIENFELRKDSLSAEYAVGDVVRFVTDLTGKVDKIISVYDYSEDHFDTSLDTGITVACRVIKGKVYDRDHDVMLVTKSGVNVEQSAFVYDNFNALRFTSAKFVVVDKNSRNGITVTSGTKDDIEAYTTHGNDCSNVIVSTRVGTCNLIVIYR